MRYSLLKESILSQFLAPQGYKTVPFITGKPGGGKSACARDIARVLQQQFDIPDERVVEFNPSLRDPTDIMGIPFRSDCGTHSQWLPPQEMYAIRRGQGPSVLILEELSDAPMPMQNPLCRVILDRFAGQMPLSDQLFIIGTGNRTEDKSGANRLSTKLGNRVRSLHFDEHLDDWTNWALDNNLPSLLIQFIRFRPNLLSDFDANRTVNPTPRSWEDVARIPETLGAGEYFEHAKGAVGEGAAAEYTGFLKLAQSMPDPAAILLDPARAEIPKDPAVLYALTGALAQMSSKDNFHRVVEYINRLPAEFNVMAMRDAQRLHPEVCGTQAFIAWAGRNSSVLF